MNKLLALLLLLPCVLWGAQPPYERNIFSTNTQPDSIAAAAAALAGTNKWTSTNIFTDAALNDMDTRFGGGSMDYGVTNTLLAGTNTWTGPNTFSGPTNNIYNWSLWGSGSFLGGTGIYISQFRADNIYVTNLSGPVVLQIEGAAALQAQGTIISGYGMQSTNFVGGGSNLVGLNASALASGTVPDARLNQPLSFRQPAYIYVVGDSRSVASSTWVAALTNAYPELVASGFTWFNYAAGSAALDYSGNTTNNIENQITNSVYANLPGAGTNRYIFINGGTVNLEFNTFNMVSNLHALCVQSNMQTIAFTLPFQTTCYTNKAQRKAWVSFNDGIRRDSQWTWLVDLDLLLDDEKWFIARYNVHENAAGYARDAEEVRRVISLTGKNRRLADLTMVVPPERILTIVGTNGTELARFDPYTGEIAISNGYMSFTNNTFFVSITNGGFLCNNAFVALRDGNKFGGGGSLQGYANETIDIFAASDDVKPLQIRQRPSATAPSQFLLTDFLNTVNYFTVNTNGNVFAAGSVTATNGYLTSEGFYLKSTNWIATNSHTFASPVYSSSTSTGAPAATELTTAAWVRGLFAGGGANYYAGTVQDTGTNTGTPNQPIYQFTSTPQPYSVRSYSLAGVDTYIGSVVTTNKFMNLEGPIVVNANLTLVSSAGGRAASVKPEIYYSYDKTNWFGDWSAPGQNITTGTNQYQWVIGFPGVSATNETGFYVQRRFKITATNGTDQTIVFTLGTNATITTASHISIPASGTSGFSIDGSNVVSGTLAAARIPPMPNITNYISIPASAFNPSSNAATAMTITNGNDQTAIPVYAFDDTAKQAVEIYLGQLPDWYPSTFNVKLKWFTTNTPTAVTTNVFWTVAIGAVTNGMGIGTNYGTPVYITNNSAGASLVNVTPASGDITPGGAGLAAGAFLKLRISRTNTVPDQKLIGNAMLVGATLQYRGTNYYSW